MTNLKAIFALKSASKSVSSWSSYTKDKSVDILLDEQQEISISKQNQVEMKKLCYGQHKVLSSSFYKFKK